MRLIMSLIFIGTLVGPSVAAAASSGNCVERVYRELRKLGESHEDALDHATQACRK